MRVLDIFGGKVRVAVSEKLDGNMRVFDESERDAVRGNQAKLGEAMGVRDLMVVRCSYDREEFTHYVSGAEVDLSDGILVERSDVGLILPLADCLGVVLYDEVQGKMMLVHAGRHNLEQDGLVRAVECMAGDPKDMRAFFSPVAGKQNYEIHKLNMGIAEAAREQLVRAGLSQENIEEMGIDTTTDEQYFSHSKGDKTARFAIGARLV
ncbi:MAG: laccase domain-containing protein [Candidatus Saccharimonadales bacterium]